MKKYKLEELQLGMEVAPEQLSEIYDKLIVLDKKYKGASTGIIVFIGDEPCTESQQAMDKCTVISPVYNDSIYLDEDVIFDE